MGVNERALVRDDVRMLVEDGAEAGVLVEIGDLNCTLAIFPALFILTGFAIPIREAEVTRHVVRFQFYRLQ